MRGSGEPRGGGERRPELPDLKRRHVVRVTIGQMAVSEDPADVLVTYSLGSCVGLCMYDADARVGGLVHCMIPLSRTDPERAVREPARFTDTGVTALLQALFDRGARKNRISAKVAGAGAPLKGVHSFSVGNRNYTILRKVLWKNGILIAAEDIGGSKARTLYLDMGSGRTLVASGTDVREI